MLPSRARETMIESPAACTLGGAAKLQAAAHPHLPRPQVWKEELNRSGVVEDAVDLVRAALAASRASASAAASSDTPSEAGAAAQLLDARAQHAVAAAAALVTAMVVAPGGGTEEVCQGNQWRAARAGVVEARPCDHLRSPLTFGPYTPLPAHTPACSTQHLSPRDVHSFLTARSHASVSARVPARLQL
jgi:hypothetical protein